MRAEGEARRGRPLPFTALPSPSPPASLTALPSPFTALPVPSRPIHSRTTSPPLSFTGKPRGAGGPSLSFTAAPPPLPSHSQASLAEQAAAERVEAERVALLEAKREAVEASRSDEMEAVYARSPLSSSELP